ncbi:Os03g0227800, partial [Oryza sativa Japonica Group]
PLRGPVGACSVRAGVDEAAGRGRRLVVAWILSIGASRDDVSLY